MHMHMGMHIGIIIMLIFFMVCASPFLKAELVLDYNHGGRLCQDFSSSSVKIIEVFFSARFPFPFPRRK